jgi:DNA-binding CsgD family transcriptional regulator
VAPTADSARMVRDVGGRAVAPIVLLRLARLPADAVAVARAVAVLGDGAALPPVAALSGLDETRVAAAARGLVAAEILRPESPLAFVHPLVRDAVYHDLAPGERELAHERAARVLTELEAAPEVIAPHLLLVPRRGDAWVATVLHEVGVTSGRRADPETAVAYLRRALAEPPPADRRTSVLLDLGRAEGLANDKSAAAEHLRAGYDEISDPRERAAIAERLSQVLMFTGSPAEVAAVTRDAARRLPPDLADLRLRLEAIELFTSFAGVSVPDATARLERARDGRVEVDAEAGARTLALVAAADWALRGGTAAETAGLVLSALDGGTLIDDDATVMTGVAVRVLALADREEALRVVDAVSAAAHRKGSLLALSGNETMAGSVWLARGELDEAEATLRRANEMNLLRAIDPEVTYGLSFLAEVLIERGELAAAADLLSRHPPAPSGSDAEALRRRAQTELLLAQRQWPQALAAAEAFGTGLRDGVVNPAWAPWRSQRAQALAALGRTEEATEELDRELAAARRWGAPRALGRVLRLIGTVSADAPLDALHEAAELTRDTSARLEHARALVALGAALQRNRRRSDSREPLRQGLELALRCGAAALADSARTALYAAGGRPRRDAFSGPESLTPSERRIAELAKEGLTNREIAQTLFVTPSTVEAHLTNLYRKLGISRRSELAGSLTGAGDDR